MSLEPTGTFPSSAQAPLSIDMVKELQHHYCILRHHTNEGHSSTFNDWVELVSYPGATSRYEDEWEKSWDDQKTVILYITAP